MTTYTYIYTTREAIALQLEGRFTVGGGASQFGPAVINDALIDLAVEQAEAKVNAALSGVYRLPLTGRQPLVISVVENLVLCKIYTTYAVGEQQLISSGQGVDRSPAGVVCRAAEQELQAIASGAVTLPGETLLSGQDPALPVSNFSGVRERSQLGARDARNINW